MIGSKTIDVDVAMKSNEKLPYALIRMTQKIVRKSLNTKQGATSERKNDRNDGNDRISLFWGKRKKQE